MQANAINFLSNNEKTQLASHFATHLTDRVLTKNLSRPLTREEMSQVFAAYRQTINFPTLVFQAMLFELQKMNYIKFEGPSRIFYPDVVETDLDKAPATGAAASSTTTAAKADDKPASGTATAATGAASGAVSGGADPFGGEDGAADAEAVGHTEAPRGRGRGRGRGERGRGRGGDGGRGGGRGRGSSSGGGDNASFTAYQNQYKPMEPANQSNAATGQVALNNPNQQKSDVFAVPNQPVQSLMPSLMPGSALANAFGYSNFNVSSSVTQPLPSPFPSAVTTPIPMQNNVFAPPQLGNANTHLPPPSVYGVAAQPTYQTPYAHPFAPPQLQQQQHHAQQSSYGRGGGGMGGGMGGGGGGRGGYGRDNYGNRGDGGRDYRDNRGDRYGGGREGGYRGRGDRYGRGDHEKFMSVPQKKIKYFIMKSFDRHDIDISIENGIWATQTRHQDKLNEAFDTQEAVILIFSVNKSKHFQGYATMQSAIGRDLQNTEWVTADGKATWGGVFRVKWEAIVDVPFNLFHTIRNPLNSNKPVKVSRDGQELPPHIGATVCSIIDQFAKKNPNPNPLPVGTNSGATATIPVTAATAANIKGGPTAIVGGGLLVDGKSAPNVSLVGGGGELKQTPLSPNPAIERWRPIASQPGSAPVTAAVVAPNATAPTASLPPVVTPSASPPAEGSAQPAAAAAAPAASSAAAVVEGANDKAAAASSGAATDASAAAAH